MILAAESFFLYSGACLFALGLITCFIPRHMRLGIISMLLGDAFFAAGIAFLGKSADMLVSIGLDTDWFIKYNAEFAVALALILYVLMFTIFVKFFKRKKKIKVEKNAQSDEIEDPALKKKATADAALFANVGKENKE